LTGGSQTGFGLESGCKSGYRITTISRDEQYKRAIRALISTRKNWSGNHTETGARAQPVLTSILQTAKQQGNKSSMSGGITVLERQTEQTGVALRGHHGEQRNDRRAWVGPYVWRPVPEHISWFEGLRVRFDDRLVAFADFDRESNQNLPCISPRGPIAILSWELPVVRRSRPDAHALQSCRPARSDRAT
jgi:hypothetical protein